MFRTILHYVNFGRNLHILPSLGLFCLMLQSTSQKKRQNWRKNGPKMGKKGGQKEPKMGLKRPNKDPKKRSKWHQDDPKMMPNDTEMTPDRPKNGPKSPKDDPILVPFFGPPKWPIYTPRQGQKWLKTGQKVTQNRSKGIWTFIKVDKNIQNPLRTLQTHPFTAYFHRLKLRFWLFFKQNKFPIPLKSLCIWQQEWAISRAILVRSAWEFTRMLCNISSQWCFFWTLKKSPPPLLSRLRSCAGLAPLSSKKCIKTCQSGA